MGEKNREVSVSIGTIITALNLATKYGIPTVVAAIHSFSGQDKITMEDLEKLEMKMKNPRDYFKKFSTELSSDNPMGISMDESK